MFFIMDSVQNDVALIFIYLYCIMNLAILQFMWQIQFHIHITPMKYITCSCYAAYTKYITSGSAFQEPFNIYK